MKKKETTPKTRSFTDAEGNRYTIEEETRIIKSTIDKHGFIYNSKGERTGNIHGHHFIEGYNYD